MSKWYVPSIEVYYEDKNKKKHMIDPKRVNKYNVEFEYKDKKDFDKITKNMKINPEFLIQQQYNNLSEKCVEKLNIIKSITKEINVDIYKLCEHNFITDTIDISPEKSQNICYCTICELSKNA